MQPKDVIKQLQLRTAQDKPFQAVMARFAQRKRARQRITLRALFNDMKKQGHPYSKEEYGVVLAQLAMMGLGKLQYNTVGNMRALGELQVSFQSIGQVATGSLAPLQPVTFRPPQKRRGRRGTIRDQSPSYKKVKTPPYPHDIKFSTSPRPPTTDTHLVVMALIIDGKTVNLPLPRPLSKQELGALITDFLVPFPTTDVLLRNQPVDIKEL